MDGEDVKQEINNINSDKAKTKGDIPVKFFKWKPDIIAPVLTGPLKKFRVLLRFNYSFFVIAQESVHKLSSSTIKPSHSL